MRVASASKTAGNMLEPAEQAADAFAAAGLVFIEDDKLDALATILHAFLIAAGLTLHETGEMAVMRSVTGR